MWCWNTAIPIHLWAAHVFCSCFHTMVAELSGGNRDHMIYKARSVYYLVLCRKYLIPYALCTGSSVYTITSTSMLSGKYLTVPYKLINLLIYILAWICISFFSIVSKISPLFKLGFKLQFLHEFPRWRVKSCCPNRSHSHSFMYTQNS